MATGHGLAFVGDWNIPADATGWRTTRWLAERTGMRVVAPRKPGRHGNIDYLVTDARASVPHRYAPPAGASQADHDIVTVILRPSPGTGEMPVRVATWNVQRDRAPAVVAAQVAQLLREHRPDVLCIQEGKQYHHALRRMARQSGYRLTASAQPGKWHNLILTNIDRETGQPSWVRLSPRGWRTVTGGEHTALWGTSVRVAWLRVVCLHLPPSVRWRRGLPVGPPMRVAALVAAVGKLRRWGSRHRRRP
jgi:hypothetical protein